MNFFEFHIGDYAAAASHLSWIEDAAYWRMLRKYYATERPLPPDLKEIQRLVGAKSKVERVAVEKVLKEFFALSENGWHNARADEEIKRYRDGEPEREVKRENQNLRQKRHRAERAILFKDLHAVGQLPNWNISTSELRALHARVTCDSHESVTHESRVTETAPETPATATHSHFPLPTTQYPLPNTQEQDARASKPQTGDDDGPRDERPVEDPQATANQPNLRNDHPGLLQDLQLRFPAGTYREDQWLIGEREARRRLDEGESLDALFAGEERYMTQCVAKGIVGTQFVMSPAKFFSRIFPGGPAPYHDAFPVPKTRGEVRQAETIDAGREWLRAQGDGA